MATARKRTRDLRSDQAGAIYVEFLVLIPFLVLIWTCMTFVSQFSTASQQNQRGIRECAWANAWQACDGPRPSTCSGKDGSVSMDGPSEVDDGELNGKVPGLQRVGSKLPFLNTSLQKLHGDASGYTRSTSRPRPSILGGDISIRGGYKVMCNTMNDEVGEQSEATLNRLREHELDPVFRETCDKILGNWCP